MLIKTIFFILLLFVSILYEKYSNKKKNISNCFYILLIILFATAFSMREFIFDDFGTDYISYNQWYKHMSFSTIDWNSINNIGFNVLIALSKIFYNNYYFFLFIVGLIINSCVLKFIDHNSKNKCLSIMIYFTFFYFNTFNIMRQWVAGAIFLLAYRYIGDRKMIKYILICLFASLFHKSAILLILLYPLLNIEKVTFKRLLIIIISGLIILANLGFIEQNIIYSGDIDLFSDYSRYANYEKGLSNYVYPIICFVNFLMLLWISKISNYDLKEKNNSIEFLYLLLALLFSLISIKSFAFARFSIYFLPIIMLTIPKAINLFRKKDKLVVSMIICLLLFYSLIT